MAKSLIIVESPAKTKTLKSFLGKEFTVEASMGHVRDLPKGSKLGVDIENNFALTYEPLKDRKDVLAKLAAAAKSADTVYLASDPDREGEAIAWHIANALKLKTEKIRRIQFNEITRSAVQQAIQNPRSIDMDRVHAQEARRALDRLVGYKISPLLWTRVARGTSAGRVQSVAVRLICDREREIQAFVPVEYWSITATLTPQQKKQPFDAALVQFEGQKIELKNQQDADRVMSALDGATYRVDKIKKSQRQRKPSAPFITSTLQQDAARKLGFSSKRTMTVAQQLYEGIDLGKDGGTVGLITYMRTDSTRIAAEAQAEAKQFIQQTYGAPYVPEKYNEYKKKGAAQDAHEAIRPTSVFRNPDTLKGKMTSDQIRLYRLIWQRFVASQMKPAIMDVVSVDILANGYTFRASGSTIQFDGFLRVYTEGKDDNAPVEDDEKPPLPPLTEGQILNLLNLLPKQHFTEPPPRFSEATLVKALEEQGIGRPSTYASIISTIQDRKYVELQEKKFYPTDLGFVVTDLLVKHFSDVVSVQFTSEMEGKLDNIEEGKKRYEALMAEFWQPLSEMLAKADENMEKAVRPTGQTCPECGGELVERFGRFGKFTACSNYPDCKYVHREAEGKEGTEPVVSEIPCPNCGKMLVEKRGRFGKFLGCPGYPECKYIHKAPPKTTGVACPSCGEGEIVEKASKKGVFYGCSKYPSCRFTLPSKPIGRNCPVCSAPLIEAVSKGEVTGAKCSNKACGFTEETLPAALHQQPKTYPV
ncbi:MAG: type I DNA topoisomerase [Armatimonadaceae bacterium]